MDSYLFDVERPRFECRADDVLVKIDDLALAPGDRVHSEIAGATVAIHGVPRRALERVLSAIDGRRTLGQVEASSGVASSELHAVLEACFGVVIFAPLAIERLERALSGTEITRFAGSPYEIVRSYWQNMIAVRAECGRLDQALADAERFRDFLRALNAMALTGADGKTPYTPASPISRKRMAPGALLETVPETRVTAEGTIFVSGPRVNVKLIGGELYHRVLYERAGDPGALDAEREVVMDGLAWGRVVRARAVNEPDFGDWFCPPRPLDIRHFEMLRASLAAALEAAGSAASSDATRASARFHWQFVRLHPFHCANQSVAMNLVNFVLSRALGAGIPHSILDQLALRLDARAYENVFGTATAAYALPGAGPVTRYRELRARKLRAFALIERIGRAPSLEQARALGDAAGPDASLALLARVG